LHNHIGDGIHVQVNPIFEESPRNCDGHNDHVIDAVAIAKQRKSE